MVTEKKPNTKPKSVDACGSKDAGDSSDSAVWTAQKFRSLEGVKRTCKVVLRCSPLNNEGVRYELSYVGGDDFWFD